MAALVGSYSTTLWTDFASLFAAQPGHHDEAFTGPAYATSGLGCVAMACGTKYANVEITLERWDDHPPEPDDRWEDADELPWITVPDAGLVQASGFDPPKRGEGLDLEGLRRGRVQVLARGRHRYGHEADTDPDELVPEEWLLRWWPDDVGLDALAGPPRRVAGRLGLRGPRAAWDSADLVPDIAHLVMWAPGGVLDTTMGRIAVRLSLPLEDVREVLGYMQESWSLVVDVEPSMAFDSRVVLRRGRR